jgi:diguanylate cyclase (GGDEF)-like protein
VKLRERFVRQGAADSFLETSQQRRSWRSGLAGTGLVLILLQVSTFAVWSSAATSAAADTAADSSALADDFQRAASMVGEEESLERKYRLEPGPAVRAHYNKAAAGLVAALVTVARDGDGGDRALVTSVLARHRKYLKAIDTMFAAVDSGNTPLVLEIDGKQVDPAFGSISTEVLNAAAEKHGVSIAHLANLIRLESTSRWLTPIVFLAGLLLALLLASIARRHGRSLEEQRSRAMHASMHDALTGLPNRTLMADRFGQALLLADRSGVPVGLLLLDLDRFKEINDTFGHHYGDALLTQIGPRLSSLLRDTDTIARLGGDEFAVLLPHVASLAEATAIAMKLRTALETPFNVEGTDFLVDASIGVVLSGDHGNDTATLLQRADIAMYVAKNKDLGVFAYDADLDSHSPAKLALLGDLRRAIDRGELVLHYQPKVSLSTGDIVDAEALVRWQHPRHGLLMPDMFIPLAENTGLIAPLTEHVLDSALAQARLWIDEGRPLTVCVNLSARNLLDQRLPAQVGALLSHHGVPAGRLKFEVTESAIMADPARAQHLLEQLAALGVRISIDDFGVGYTSLGQLKTMPLTELKIDRSFVMTMTTDRPNALIVHSVIDLGHNLGLTIVAEGVEDAETLTVLQGLGCDTAQGYHLARPMPAHAFDNWRHQHEAKAQEPVATTANLRTLS